MTPFYNIKKEKVGCIFVKDEEIIIVYRGTLDYCELLTDTDMLLTKSDELLLQNGILHSGFYLIASQGNTVDL